MGKLKDELEQELRAILDDLIGLDFDEEVRFEIKSRCVDFLTKKGIPEENLPVINLKINSDGFIDIDMVYPKTGVWN